MTYLIMLTAIIWGAVFYLWTWTNQGWRWVVCNILSVVCYLIAGYCLGRL